MSSVHLRVFCASVLASMLFLTGCGDSGSPRSEITAQASENQAGSPPADEVGLQTAANGPVPAVGVRGSRAGRSSGNSDVTGINAPKLDLIRTPHGGIQPQVAVEAGGTVHLIYFKGKPLTGDIFYVRRQPDAETFSQPIRVNSQPAAAIATGTIRGAQMALGKNGRVHVAWNGSSEASPKGADGKTPMLYTRMNDAGTGFEPQKNVMQFAWGLDGGGSVAADGAGNVYVAWHAGAGTEGEEARQVWVARSSDEGQTFSRETPAWSEKTGACGCCGLRIFADSRGTVYALYRSAAEVVHRDTYLLASTDGGKTFRGELIDPWEIGGCPMSSFAIAETPTAVLGAWQTREQVYFGRIAPDGLRGRPMAAPGSGNNRKHPVLAGNARGETILVWTEGTGWNKGGSLAWQVYDKSGEPLGKPGRTDGIPTWSFAAVFSGSDGGFTIVY